MRKEINMRRQGRRRTLRDYREMIDNRSPQKFGLNLDGTPRQTYAPVMPPDPYPSPYEKPVYGLPATDYEEYDGN